jgi:hypothetical protein
MFSVWRNPMARSCDRVRALLAMILIGLWLLALPVAVVAGSMIWASGSATAAQENADRTKVSAELLADAPLPQLSSHGFPLKSPATVAATWLNSSGAVQTGLIPVSSGQYAGDHVSIWLDRSGAAADPPTNVADAAGRAIMVGLGGWLAMGLVLVSLNGMVRRSLNVRNRARWDAEWQLVEPLWSSR